MEEESTLRRLSPRTRVTIRAVTVAVDAEAVTVADLPSNLVVAVGEAISTAATTVDPWVVTTRCKYLCLVRRKDRSFSFYFGYQCSL